MESESLRRVLLFCLVALHCSWLAQVKAQSAVCTTPTNLQGLCVPIQRCRNIFKITQLPSPPPVAVANYIRKAECTLPGVERSICCQPAEVEPEMTTNLLPKDCGQSVAERIANGNLTRVFDYPWMALLRYAQNGEILDGCGGSLINKRYVLTAAHCLKTRSTLQLDHIRLGEHTRSEEIDCIIFRDKKGAELERDCADPVEDYGVESIIIHPDYNRPKYSNDIGLVRLNRDVTMKDHIRPICLPVTPKLRSLQFDKYIVTGWGTTENQTGSDILLSAILPRVDIDSCQQRMAQNRLNVQLSSKQLCAGGEGQVDTCRGDSGGPLGFSTEYNGARFVQFGIVSAGVDSCGLKSVPGIYCRVDSYMDWILENIKP
ncbi:serine protease grass-like [Toxorhynchites rutilus septentrionalis]|uniref:serine protease grass-like n=1 Tax=Toxorhynchites rutilus septentrionalis TaxID=329112 RepID=UPI00247B2329|nr:serine protease grass-like [Toxorhynchites rutilus septentrionalis]